MQFFIYLLIYLFIFLKKNDTCKEKESVIFIIFKFI